MRNAWKWILGILLVLVILSIPFLLHYAFGNNLIRGFAGRGPMMMERFDFNHPGFGRGFRGPMGMRGGFGFFTPFRFLGGLVELIIFGALLYGAYWLGRRNARVVIEPAPVATVVNSNPPPTPRDEANDTKTE